MLLSPSCPLIAPAGQLDDSVARGLDFVLAEAAKYGIKLTPVLLNLWKSNGRVPWFEKMCAGRWGHRGMGGRRGVGRVFKHARRPFCFFALGAAALGPGSCCPGPFLPLGPPCHWDLPAYPPWGCALAC